MPKRGDTLYRIGQGQLEKATFFEESLADPGCTITTYVVKEYGALRRSRCSKTMWVDTERKAWERYLVEIEDALPGAEKSVLEAVRTYGYVRAEQAKVKEILEGHPHDHYRPE